MEDLLLQLFGYWAIVLVVYFFVVFWIPLSILWAPFAGLISACQARAKGRNVRYYWLMGMLYSATLFLPWVYLTVRLREKRMPPAIALVGYIVVYVAWGLTLLMTNTFLETRAGMASYAVSIAGVSLIIVSAVVLLRKYGIIFTREQRREENTRYEHTIGDLQYIVPFVLAIAQALVLVFSLAVPVQH